MRVYHQGSLKRYLLLLGIVLILCSGQLFAQTSGKVVGVVRDAETGQGLVGANVILAGTNLGAATDPDGYYTIINIPPGVYDVQATYMGYKRITQTGVFVAMEQISTINFDMEIEAIEGEEVVVVAERDILHKEVSNSQLVVGEQEMVETSGVRDLTDYFGRQVGVTGQDNMEIRGGSADQTGAIVNGLTFVNPRVGRAEASLPISSVEQVSLVTGGYSAEYGNFRSGLINITTKTGDKDAYHGSFNYSRNNAPKKRFGKSLYDPTNVWLRPIFDPEVAFVGTRTAWPRDEFPIENNTYPSFNGWNRMETTYNRSAETPEDEISALELYLWGAWAYQIVPDWDALEAYYNEQGLEYTVTDEQKKAIEEHAHDKEGENADYNIDFGFGGPLPYLSEQLGNATFYFSHQTLNTNYIQPVTDNSKKSGTSLLTIKSELTQNTTLQLNGIYRKVNGHLDVMPSSGALPSLGSDDNPNVGGGGMMGENNLGVIYNQGSTYFWHPTFWHPKEQTFLMGGIKLNSVINQNAFWDFTLSYTWQKDESNPQTTRDSEAIIQIGPVWLNEMPYGRTFTADTVRNPDDPTDYYVHSLFEDAGGAVVSATGRRFSGKTGQYHENSITQQLRAKFDYSNQINRHHFIKTGAELNYYDLNNDLWTYWAGYDTDYDMRFHVKPWQGGLYIQDQITYEGVVARVGLRADYYNSGGVDWPTGDLFNGDAFVEGPEGAHPAMDQYRYEMMSQGVNIAWDRMRAIEDSVGGLMEKSQNHFALSPRIGVSFPVTERSKFYFNYGHFRSQVPYSEMYMYNFRYSKGQGLNQIGNPSLEPPRTISYELGGSYNLLDQYLITVSGFYKDVTGQHTNVTISGASISDGYSSRANNAYEDIQGLEVDVRKPAGKYLTGWVNLRYLLTKDGQVGREFIYEDAALNNDPLEIYYEAEENTPVSQPIVNASMTFHVPEELGLGRTMNAAAGGWKISGAFTWEKGRKFTHNPLDLRNVQNNLSWPDYYMFDMKISKLFSVLGVNANVYVDVQNVLNLKVNWMSRGWAFLSAIDREDYLNSLQLPMYSQQEYVDDGSFVSGNDKVGDLRSDSKDYINDPNYADVWLYGEPREIWFGINVSF